MTQENSHYEKSIWSIKVNNQLLYKKEIDGITILRGVSEEENNNVANIINKAIADANNVLSWRESKREALATNADEDELLANSTKISVWAVRINSQLLYKKTTNGRTILFGMNENEHRDIAGIMDSAFNELGQVLESKTTFRESKEENKKEVTNIDPMEIAMATLKSNTNLEEEMEQVKKEIQEAKSKAPEEPDTPLREKITKATTNELREKIQDKKASSSNTSFWDKLK